MSGTTTVTLALGLGIALCVQVVHAQQPPFSLSGARLQERANSVLALMSYTVVPDLTSSSLAIESGQSGNPALAMTQLAGGFTVSQSTPLYLEGGIAASRYDPTFYATNGQQERAIPVKWNSVSLNGGIGWDFPVGIPDLKFRPIFNFSVGTVTSDLLIAKALLANNAGIEGDLAFLDKGRMDAYGLGGSVMLDYERFRPEGDIDVELRYSDVRLESFGGTAPALKGSADAKSASLWSRYRAPTGFTALDRPVRYVLEYAFTRYLGDQAGILGFDYLNSVGVGLELDSSKYDIFITRTRLVARYMFGNNVSGYSVGLAVSF